MPLFDLAASAIPPAVLSRIKLELRAHLVARGNKTNGAAMGSIISKACSFA